MDVVNLFMRNSTKIRKRGRPRGYDPEVALRAALDVFWERGYSGTSLDALSEATKMNRPSLYAAFGDKKSIYRKALDVHYQTMRSEVEGTLFAGRGLREDLTGFYEAARKLYQKGEGQGCPTLCTATAEASSDPDIQADLSAVLIKLDRAFQKRFQLDGRAQAKGLGDMAAAVLHSLAIRMRAGHSEVRTKRFIRESVDLLLGD